jgi:hypothetical protein
MPGTATGNLSGLLPQAKPPPLDPSRPPLSFLRFYPAALKVTGDLNYRFCFKSQESVACILYFKQLDKPECVFSVFTIVTVFVPKVKG